MSGLLMINELNEHMAKLAEGVRLMAKYGKEFAEAERAYKVELSQEALKLRDKGMSVTLIDKVIYGNCADKRFKRDVAEVMYKTAQENVNATKLRIRILDAQISREWGRSGSND